MTKRSFCFVVAGWGRTPRSGSRGLSGPGSSVLHGPLWLSNPQATARPKFRLVSVNCKDKPVNHMANLCGEYGAVGNSFITNFQASLRKHRHSEENQTRRHPLLPNDSVCRFCVNPGKCCFSNTSPLYSARAGLLMKSMPHLSSFSCCSSTSHPFRLGFGSSRLAGTRLSGWIRCGSLPRRLTLC